MVIDITNQCFFDCSHCMKNSQSYGLHMTDQIFYDILKFIKKYTPIVILISGGEPTLHPNFKEIVEKFSEIVLSVVITSNGWFLTTDGQIPLDFQIKKSNVLWQITNDQRYYNVQINADKNNAAYAYVDKIQQLQRCSKLPNIETTAQCMNIRVNHGCFPLLIDNSIFKTFKDIITFSEMRTMFCKPLIDIDGNIFIGETDLCKSIGTIYNTSSELLAGIYKPCDNCKGQNSALKLFYKKKKEHEKT